MVLQSSTASTSYCSSGVTAPSSSAVAASSGASVVFREACLPVLVWRLGWPKAAPRARFRLDPLFGDELLRVVVGGSARSVAGALSTAPEDLKSLALTPVVDPDPLLERLEPLPIDPRDRVR